MDVSWVRLHMPRPKKGMWQGSLISEIFICSLAFQFSKSQTHLLGTSCCGVGGEPYYLAGAEVGITS